TPPKAARGSFDYDQASAKYTMRWDSFKAFEAWRDEEEVSRVIQFRLVNTYNKTGVYERQLRYVCSRAGTGGVKNYVKLHPQWKRKCEGRGTDCPCTLTVKEYPGTPVILGNYSDKHNHDLGNANLRFTSISDETREYIAGMLRMK
ncbi:hypothetical protein B0H16DRAFT_1273978, partial [Mycena metata]